MFNELKFSAEPVLLIATLAVTSWLISTVDGDTLTIADNAANALDVAILQNRTAKVVNSLIDRFLYGAVEFLSVNSK